jgi:flagellar motility protein MotE (MotC chaperone)
MDMSPNQAAVILTQLSFADQVLVLRAMNSADEASILAVMPPKQAAKLLQAGA